MWGWWDTPLLRALGLCGRAANSGCRAVAGCAAPGGDVRVVAELGRGSVPGGASQAGKQGGGEAGEVAPVAVSSMALTEAVDTVVIASEGVWCVAVVCNRHVYYTITDMCVV